VGFSPRVFATRTSFADVLKTMQGSFFRAWASENSAGVSFFAAWAIEVRAEVVFFSCSAAEIHAGLIFLTQGILNLIQGQFFPYRSN